MTTTQASNKEKVTITKHSSISAISNSISSSITPDLLSNIDLNGINLTKIEPATKTNSSKRISLPSSKLATQNIEYEPVFK
jgi:hypothetical protein